MNTLKALILATAALSAASGYAQTRHGPFDLPFEPIPPVLDLLPQTGAWQEVYPLEADNLSEAMATITSTGKPPALMALVAGESFHAGVGKTPVSLPQYSVTLTRNGSPLAYADDCSVVPQLDDRVALLFGSPSGGPTLRIEGGLLGQYYFGKENAFKPDLIALPAPSAENCADVEQSRLFFYGTMTYRSAGEPSWSVPVLFQSVVVAAEE